MEQLGRLAGRCTGEVVLLDQCDMQSPASRVTRASGADDAPADDQQVEDPSAGQG